VGERYRNSWAGRLKKEVSDGALCAPCEDDSSGGVQDPRDVLDLGPPFDPLVLADTLKLEIIPRADVPEARTVPMGRSSVYIEFNPNRPSVASSFFDCARNRSYAIS
jgi:hypothetical protein